jgi:hypothetical protein
MPILLSVLSSGSGCLAAGDAGDIDGSVAVPRAALAGPVGANGLSPVDFWAPSIQADLRDLGDGALLTWGGALVNTDLLDTAGGRSVLEYTIRCALSDGTTVQRDGYAFEGDLALAPAWTSRGLTTSEQRWMTACLLQHLNGLGASVPIMLEGSHPALVPDEGDDVSEYTIPDTTAFGNLFLPPLLGLLPKAYVCLDPGLDLACGAGLSLYTLERICGLSPTCGITVLGLCDLVCTYDEEGDPTCTAPLGSTYPQAIVSKLDESLFLSLWPLCELP